MDIYWKVFVASILFGIPIGFIGGILLSCIRYSC